MYIYMFGFDSMPFMPSMWTKFLWVRAEKSTRSSIQEQSAKIASILSQVTNALKEEVHNFSQPRNSSVK